MIEIVETEEKLHNLVVFLGIQFQWAPQKQKNIVEALTKFNFPIKKYGLILYDDNRVMIGGMLLFYQGVYKSATSKKILNMSSIYIVPQAPLHKKINFINAVTKINKNYIITNYTSNSAVYQILKRSGFEDMPIFINEFKLYKIGSILGLISFMRSAMSRDKSKCIRPVGTGLQSRLQYKTFFLNMIFFEKRIKRVVLFKRVNFKTLTIDVISEGYFSKTAMIVLLFYRFLFSATIKAEFISEQNWNSQKGRPAYMVFGLEKPMYIVPTFSELEVVPQE